MKTLKQFLLPVLESFEFAFFRQRTSLGCEIVANSKATLSFASYRWQQHCRGLEKLGTLTQKVTVGAREEKKLDFVFKSQAGA